jgi:HEAT repeat protein
MSELLELLGDYSTEIAVAMVLSVVLFVLLRRYFAARQAREQAEAPPAAVSFTPSAAKTANPTAAASATNQGEPHEMNSWEPPASIPASALATASAVPQQPERPDNVTVFGAYRIEQEVSKLAEGQPHRVEILASRAPEDRKAIEAALMKNLYAPNTEAATRDRLRRALEDYGFVARRSAEILLAEQLQDRATAARILGAVGGEAALPFLLEALYDPEEAVRLRAVESLGELRLPGAIGALLDLARRHPELPPSVLSNALNACSVESLSFFDFPMEKSDTGPLLLAGEEDWDDEELTEVEDLILTPEQGEADEPVQVSSVIADLPSGGADERVLAILEKLEQAGVEQQAELYRSLGHIRTQVSVATLALVATHNPEPSLRSAAVSALCEIDHPTGFAPILLAVGDESREVRAAAARSFSRLSFERSDAYLTLAQTEPPERMAAIALACVKAGMASQAMDRLVSSDQRQAYESYALLSLLTKAGEFGPLLEAVAHHRSKDVRLCVLRLLIDTRDPRLVDQLRHLAVSEGISDEMRNALLEAIYKIQEGGRQGRESVARSDNLVARVA